MDLNSIKFLESITNIKKIVKKLTKRTLSPEQAQSIVACLQQDRLFFQTAESASLEIKPLEIYYGLVGFSKAISLCFNKN